ncbi:hypothetical protein FF3_02166 [Fretibacterium fastidiosum]
MRHVQVAARVCHPGNRPRKSQRSSGTNST